MHFLAALLPSLFASFGCQGFGDMYDCENDMTCEWVQAPPFCTTGCLNLNCLPAQPSFNCNNCYLSAGIMMCDAKTYPPINGLCQSKTDPIYTPPRIWEPVDGTWDQTVKQLNDERAKRGQCPLKWSDELAMECTAGGVVGGKCAKLSDDGFAHDFLWHTTFGGTAFSWDTSAVYAATQIVASFSQSMSVGQWVMKDEAAELGCCICREDHHGQAVLTTTTCLARKANKGSLTSADVISPIGSPQQMCAGNGGGMGMCDATVVSMNGVPLSGKPLAAADLTSEHVELLGTGQLNGFSSVAASGAPDGEIVLLPGDKVGSGDVLSFECSAGCDKECEVYVVAYHCSKCPGSLHGDIVEKAQAKEWEVSSCAPALQVGGESYPTVSLRRVLAPGSTVTFPHGVVKGAAVLTFRRELGAGCPSLGEAACKADPACVFKGGSCLTEAWCPKRFVSGPFPPVMGPGCSTKCLA